MGSCISKYRRPATHKPSHQYPTKENSPSTSVVVVQDKLIITSSQVHPTPPPLISKSLIEPISPSPSSSSASTTNTASSLLSSSSCSSSSILVSKERSFSNEFLWSCIKENPHVINRKAPDGTDDHPENKVINQENFKFEPVPTKLSSSSSSVLVSSKLQSVLPKRSSDQSSTVPQKRAGSPVVCRQKSLIRRESNASADQTMNHNDFIMTRRNSSAYYSNSSPIHQSRISRETRCKGISRNSSPKRSNDHRRPRESSLSKSKGTHDHVPIHHENYYYSPSTGNKENLGRTGSPFNFNRRDCYGSSRKRETTCTSTTHHVRASSSVLGEMVNSGTDHKDLNSLQIDDLDNPLISLDCFIFL